ncbi:hypothetical protein LTR36_005758 [Oleoguttula mirabilis]|uniref:BHLH domain-containing protein n=1 Tax=Oleoguttula mirabilis TaxID=1507867 RepID=A0AAV9JDV9_9PEZI|nr:hypothetical protein LTR36_005758 [Oleoguttula mirabilis]
MSKRARGDVDSMETSVVGKPRKASKRQSSTLIRQPPSQTPHKLVERRYRHNINAHLDKLSQKLPALRDVYACAPLDIEDSGARVVKAPPKATVIAAAAKYIERLESEKVKANDFVRALQEQVEGLQKLVRCDDCAVLRYLERLQVPSQQDGDAPLDAVR